MKRVLLILSVLSMMVIAVGISSAQDRRPRPEGRDGILGDIIEIVKDETGLMPQDILQQLRDEDVTLADIIEANGGDVDTVVNSVVTSLTERINQGVADGKIPQERADEMLNNLEQHVRDAINGNLPIQNRDGRPIRNLEFALLDAITDATGLDGRAILEQIQDGTTLATIITENGGDVDSVISTAIATATERVNGWVEGGQITQEQADRLLENLETVYTTIVNGDALALRNNAHPVIGLVRSMAEATGMNMIEIGQALRDGQTPAQILSDHGVDVDSFISDQLANARERLDSAVSEGRITQEQADTRFEKIQTTLTERMNSNTPLRPRPNGDGA